jgi:hypothetical protein
MADPTNNMVNALSPADQAAMQPETFANPLVKQKIDNLVRIMSIPGQTLQSQQPLTTDDMLQPARDMTGQFGAIGLPMAKSGSLGMAGGRTVMPGAVPLRAPGGKFLKPLSDARGMPNPFIPEEVGYKVPKPGEVAPTAGPSNPMYTPETAPDMNAANKLLERKQTDQLNVNPADVERWKSTMPLNLQNTPPELSQLIKALLGK